MSASDEGRALRAHRTTFPVSHPRPRHQVHHRRRRRLHHHRHPNHPHTGASTARQRHRRTLRPQHPQGTTRPHSDHQPAPRSGRAARVRTPFTTTTDHTALRRRPLPFDHSPTTQQPRSTTSEDATGSAACSTNISRAHEGCRVSGTYTRARSRLHNSCPSTPHCPQRRQLYVHPHQCPKHRHTVVAKTTT